MELVKVEFVVLHRVILDRPLLDGSLGRCDGRSSIRVEYLFRQPYHVHKELGRLVLVEEHCALHSDGRLSQACEPPLVGIESGELTYAVILCWYAAVPALNDLDVELGPVGII